MRQGLIANWHRRLAVKGLYGAALVAVPVAVASTIGFGGAGGLSSLATGPGESALGGSVAEEQLASKSKRSIESLTSTLPIVTAEQRGGAAAGETAASGSPIGTGVTTQGTTGSPASGDGGGGGGEGGSGGGISGGAVSGGPASEPGSADPTGDAGGSPPPGSSDNNIGVNVGNYLGDGSNQNPGIVNQLLQGLGLRP